MEMIEFCPDADKIINVAHWAGKMTDGFHRGGAYEFSDPQPVQMRGALVSIYSGRKGGETKNLRAPDPRPTVTRSAFLSATGVEQCVQSATEMHVGPKPPKFVGIWMFKNVTVSPCAEGRCRRRARDRDTFFVERRGGSPLDATSRTAREWVARYAGYSKVRAGELTTEQAIQGPTLKEGPPVRQRADSAKCVSSASHSARFATGVGSPNFQRPRRLSAKWMPFGRPGKWKS